MRGGGYSTPDGSLFPVGHLGELTALVPFELVNVVLERARAVQRWVWRAIQRSTLDRSHNAHETARAALGVTGDSALNAFVVRADARDCYSFDARPGIARPHTASLGGLGSSR